MSTSAVDVSVVIVNWNSGDHLAACLKSLAANPPGRSWTAVVVDNASTDASLEQARAAGGSVTYVRNTRNRGLAAANNQGMIAVPSEYVILANPDVLFEPGSVDALCDLLDRRPRAATVMPQLMQAAGALQVSAMALPSVAAALVPGVRRSSQARGFRHDAEVRIGHGADACFAVRRSAVAAVGALDEGYPLDWEAIDWSRRFARAGWETWFTPAARVVHAGGVSVRQVPYRWIAQSHLGMYRYLTDHRPWLAPVVAPVVAARAGLKAAATAVGRARYDRAQQRARLSDH